jgi:hypothetical protein
METQSGEISWATKVRSSIFMDILMTIASTWFLDTNIEPCIQQVPFGVAL